MNKLVNLVHPQTAADWRTLLCVMLAWDLLTLTAIYVGTKVK
jgi:hypothetical protein